MIKSLNGLRALAMLGIFLFHSGLLLKGTFPVTFFFILSGFMTYYTLSKRREIISFKDKANWFFNKTIKFYPIHLLTFFMSIAIRWDYVVRLNQENQLAISAVLNLTLLQTLFEEYSLSFNNLSWFLSCIVIIYSLSFWLLKLVKRIEVDKCKFVIIFIFIVQCILNYINSVEIYSIYMLLLASTFGEISANNFT